MSGFELNESNGYINQIYCENDNYKIIYNTCRTNKCMIFFSGNGLYYPNTIETFTEVIIEKDRYEWQNVMKSQCVQETYQMIVFVRDVYKTFYQKGINKKLDTIDKVLSFLKKITNGYEIVTCGNSAGGYMATIAGNYLNAQCVYNFGGQWDINNKPGYFLEHSEEKKYFNIVEFAKDNVMWFWAAYNEEDCSQKEYLHGYEKDLYCFAIDSKYHGAYLLSACYKYIVTFPIEELRCLCEKYNNKVISKRKIAKEILYGAELFTACFDDVVSEHKSLQIICSILGKLTNLIKKDIK